MNFIVGLTGGIGSGKTFIAELFSSLGATIIDADQIAHALTAPGGAALPTLVAHFGDSYLTPQGELDRAKLRTKVFADKCARDDLEALLHPLIRTAMDEQSQQHAAAPYLIHVIPLLIESNNWRTRVHRVLVVDCPEALQIQRVMQRSKLHQAEVEAVMANQVSRAQRLAHADDVIDNSHNNVLLKAQVSHLHQRYLDFAKAHRPPPPTLL